MFKKLIDFIDSLFNKDEVAKIKALETELQELKFKLSEAEKQISTFTTIISEHNSANKFLIDENNKLKIELSKSNQNNEIVSKFKEFMGELEFQELISLSNVLVK